MKVDKCNGGNGRNHDEIIHEERDCPLCAALDMIDELLEACDSMLECCGKSETVKASDNWNGETHDSLLKIETAVKLAKDEYSS